MTKWQKDYQQIVIKIYCKPRPDIIKGFRSCSRNSYRNKNIRVNTNTYQEYFKVCELASYCNHVEILSKHEWNTILGLVKNYKHNIKTY